VASSSPPLLSDLMLLSSDLQGMSVALVVIGITHLLRVLKVPPSSSGTEATEPSSKRVCPGSFLPVSSRYVHGVGHLFMPLPLLLFLF
jgi:hypothetical protein